MGESNSISPSFHFTIVNQMNKTIVCLKAFTTRNPDTGRTVTFVPGDVVRGKKLDYVKDAHFARGIFTVAGNDDDCSIKRRAEGRILWHTENGTNKDVDLEYLAHACMLNFMGNDVLRSKGNGQNGMMDSLLRAIHTEFAGRFVIEMVEGNDDVRSTRVGERGILWADTERTAMECIAFCAQYLTKYGA